MEENERIRRFVEALKVAISCIEDCEYASQKVCNSRIDAAITSWREYVEANNIDDLMEKTKEERTSTDYLTYLTVFTKRDLSDMLDGKKIVSVDKDGVRHIYVSEEGFDNSLGVWEEVK